MKIGPHSTIGIIGGGGKTGGQFAELFRSASCAVDVTGSKTHDRNADLFVRCDVVIFAVPLARSVAIIEEEISHATRQDQLILDLSSLKEPQVNSMLRAQGEVIGMHPLFAPTTDPRGQTIILCPGRASDETVVSLQEMLHRMGLRTVLKDPHAHDRLMALLQVLPHLKNFLVADVLRKIDANVSEILGTCTPAYELELNVVGRFLDDNPDLYGPIILQNPDTLMIMRTFRDVLDDSFDR